MADIVSITAETRERAGKGAARATRRAGRVPAVIYGNKETPLMISLDPVELMRQIRGGSFFSRVFEIEADGAKHRVLPRDIQQDPVTDQPIHIDFMRFSKTTRVVVEVPVVFVGEDKCPGLRQGGVLNIVRHAIEMRVSPDSIPETVELNLEGYNIGDSVHISTVELPGDVELTITDRDFTVVTIAAPTVITETEGAEDGEGEEGAAEGEEGAAEGESED